MPKNLIKNNLTFLLRNSNNNFSTRKSFRKLFDKTLIGSSTWLTIGEERDEQWSTN